ncbi:MAG: hypothetical protein ACP5MD_16685 [Verrucomicrobiia bacterium]
MTDNSDNLKDPTLYQEFLAERAEILKHKWIESEKAGYDIGFERALSDWLANHRNGWLMHRRARQSKPCDPAPAAQTAGQKCSPC